MRAHPATVALLEAWRNPARAASFPPEKWSAILAATRRSRALGHLRMAIEARAGGARPDERVLAHFESVGTLVADRRRRLRREMSELSDAVRDLGVPVLLLKGAAYEALDLPIASGRLAADIDVLVPAQSIATIERRMVERGWEPAKMNDYDDRYYREWSHEIPPLVHPERGVEVDVHHSITPSLRGRGIDTAALLARSVEVEWEGRRGFRVLQPIDLLIHCAVHTFKDSDLTLRLRETMDFDLLFRHFAGPSPDAFAASMLERAAELGQPRAIWWAMHFARRWLDTPISDSAMAHAAAPGAAAIASMDWLTDRSMLPGARIEREGLDRFAAIVLLARYHYQRMPITRLVPHLLEKSRRRHRPAETADADP